MIKKTEKKSQTSMFFSLKDTLDQKHPLFILEERINWQQFEEAFSVLYCADNGRPALPIRLMVGLLIIKHLRNISDESVVEQYSENVYYQ
jgi:IS5 family transposase